MAAKEALALYRFNTKVAWHYFWEVCGIQLFTRPRAAPEVYTVNLNCVDNFDPPRSPLSGAPSTDASGNGPPPPSNPDPAERSATPLRSNLPAAFVPPSPGRGQCGIIGRTYFFEP